jgi:hypothetical protein
VITTTTCCSSDTTTNDEPSKSTCCGQGLSSTCASEPSAQSANIPSQPTGGDDDDDGEEEAADRRTPLIVGNLELPEMIQSLEQLSDYAVLFIGDPESSSSQRQYVNIMLCFLSLSSPPETYWTYSPQSQSLETSLPTSLQKQLNRRFFLTQKARDAQVYGILVSNLSQQHLVEVVKSLKQRIQDAGKASYSFAVGKINPAKLANFAEIDCFVLVACREHSLLSNEREYHLPVITPLELDIALGNLTWGAQSYSLDCQDVLGYRSTDKAEMESDDDDDAPYFSLVTGKYVKPAGTKTSEAPLELEHLPGKGQVTAYKSEAADFLKQREYQGLSTLAGQTEVKAAVVGQRGIASDYGGS